MAHPDQITTDIHIAAESGPALIVVMGVSGTGKTTLGAALARALHMPYIEGDDLHPTANVEKMAAGTPLNDADRLPWLALIRATAQRTVEGQLAGRENKSGRAVGGGVVVTCSSLKKFYREILRGRMSADTQGVPERRAGELHMPTYFVFIQGEREVLMDRMSKRAGHFMKASMLDSQLETLESPVGEEGVVVVSVESSTEEQVRQAKEALAQMGAFHTE